MRIGAMQGIFTSLLFLTLAVVPGSAQWVDLTVSIAQAGSPRRVWVGEERSQVFVLVSNVSDKPQRVWQAWNSWGAHTIELEVIDGEGRKLGVIRNAQHAWTMNAPTYDTISPGESQVFPISIYSLGNWEIHGDRLEKMARDLWTKVRIRARYTITSSTESQKHQVWTGSLVSPLYHFDLQIKSGYTNPRR